jgi:CRISPR-associated protein Cst2
VYLTTDFGVMARQEGDPAPFEHQFYRATLQGLLSLSLNDAGTFTYSRRSGFQNLDSIRKKQAEEQGLEHIPEKLAYRLPIEQRVQRVQRLIEAIPLVQGGAKQTLHYTDVSPVVAIAAITRNGNHPFNYLFTEQNGEAVFNVEAFARAITSAPDQYLSPIGVGWKPGYAPAQESKVDDLPEDVARRIVRATPIEVFRGLAQGISESPEWMN